MANKAKIIGLNDVIEVANKTRLAREAAQQATKFLKRGGEVAVKANERIASARKAMEALPAALREAHKSVLGELPAQVEIPGATPAETATVGETPAAS